MTNKIKLVFFNTYIYTLFLIYSMVTIPLMSFGGVFVIILSTKRKFMKYFRRSISIYGYILIKIVIFPFLRVDYKDESLKKEKGPFIFVVNHRSLTDAFLMACLPVEAIQVVKDWATKIPVLGLYARSAGYINLSKLTFEQYEEKVSGFLKQGVSVICFPEGTRSRGKEMGHFHSSIFKIALKERCRLVPLCIAGNEDKPCRGSLVLHPGKVIMRRLEAIDLEKENFDSAFRLKTETWGIMDCKLRDLDELLK